MQVMHIRPVAATIAVLLVGACSLAGSPPGPVPSPSGSAAPGRSPSPPPASSELLVRVAYEGGFVAPLARLAQPPIVSVYADGRIIGPAPVTMEYPGRLVPPLQVRSVGADGAAAIVDAAAAAGLATADATYPAVGIADAPDTVFTVVRDGTRIITRIGALAEGTGVAGGQGASEPVRKAAAACLARFIDPAGGLGTPASTLTPYAPAAFQVWVTPGEPAASDPALVEQPVAWPLAVPLATFGKPETADEAGAGVRVGVVAGSDAATLGPILARATVLTPFQSGGRTFTLQVRPLLPDEAPPA